MARATDLEKQNLEAHVDLCEQRYNNLEKRLGKVEEKVQHIHDDLPRRPDGDGPERNTRGTWCSGKSRIGTKRVKLRTPYFSNKKLLS